MRRAVSIKLEEFGDGIWAEFIIRTIQLLRTSRKRLYNYIISHRDLSCSRTLGASQSSRDVALLPGVRLLLVQSCKMASTAFINEPA